MITRWGDLCTLEYGKALRNCAEEPSETDCYQVFGTNGPIGWTSEPLCREAGIIIGRKGAYRGVHFSREPFFVIDTAYYLRLKNENVDMKWAYYNLLSVDINRIDVGAAIPTTNRESFYAVPVRVPSLFTQRRITSILSAYDDLIENNLRRIKLLEESARLLYKEWFVRLRFPGYEHTRIVGRVPQGWEKVKVGSILSKMKRRRRIPKDSYLSEGPIPCIDQSGEFIGGYTDEPESLHDSPLPVVVFGDHTRILKFVSFPFASGADGTHILYPNRSEISSEFLYHALQFANVSNFFYARHFKFLKEQETYLADTTLMREFTHVAKPIYEQVRTLRLQNQKLRQARDILPPKLMSGEVEVKSLRQFPREHKYEQRD